MFIGIAREDADAAVDKMAETTLRAEHLREDADAAVDSKFFGVWKTRRLCPANVPRYIRMSDEQISTYTTPPDHPPHFPRSREQRQRKRQRKRADEDSSTRKQTTESRDNGSRQRQRPRSRQQEDLPDF